MLSRVTYTHVHYQALIAHTHTRTPGVAYYGAWMTKQSNPDVSDSDWLIMCGQNGDAPSILANGKEVSLKVAGGSGDAQLTINKDAQGAAWDVVGISIWNRILSAEELKQAAAAYADFLHESFDCGQNLAFVGRRLGRVEAGG